MPGSVSPLPDSADVVILGGGVIGTSAAFHLAEAGVDISSGAEITEVVTDHGSIRTSTVICAAGAWSRSCGAMVGLDLPVTPLRRQILFTEAMDGLPAQIPMTIDFESSFYFHREGPGY